MWDAKNLYRHLFGYGCLFGIVGFVKSIDLHRKTGIYLKKRHGSVVGLRITERDVNYV